MLVAIGVGLLTILTLGFFVRKAWRDRLQAEDKVLVAQAENEIARLRGMRGEIEKGIGEKDEAILIVDRQISTQREIIEDRMRTGAGMSDEEIAAEFARMGM